MRYTERDVISILRQLQSIKRPDGNPVFLAWLEDASPEFHTIMLDTGVGVQVLEFRKAHENTLPEEGSHE